MNLILLNRAMMNSGDGMVPWVHWLAMITNSNFAPEIAGPEPASRLDFNRALKTRLERSVRHTQSEIQQLKEQRKQIDSQICEHESLLVSTQKHLDEVHTDLTST